MRKSYLLGVSFTLCISLSSFGQNNANRLEDIYSQIKKGQYQPSNYNTACLFAVKGDHQIALKYLEAAIDNDNFDDVKAISEDSDLVSLHTNAAWKDLIGRVRQNGERKERFSKLFFNDKGFWDSKFLKSPFQDNLAEEEKIIGLSKLWSELKYNFANFDLSAPVHIDSLYRSYLPKVGKTTSTLQYVLLLEEMVAQLHDAHTNVNAPQELIDSIYARPLLRSRMIEDKVIVVGVYDNKLSQAGIGVGDEILQVNGMPVRDYAEKKIIPYQSCSTEQDRLVRGYEYALFRGNVNEPIRLELSDRKGKKYERVIDRVKSSARSAKVNYLPFEFKMLPGNIAHVVLNSFGSDEVVKGFRQHFDQIAKADAIIFDVRNNGGGSTGYGWSILGSLISQGQWGNAAYTRTYKPSFRAWGYNQPVELGRNYLKVDPEYHYNKPVVVLTSARTFSAAEDFAAAFRVLSRGKIIGEATGGSSGQPLMIDLVGNITARICSKRDLLADESEFIGKGVQPDIVCAQTLTDLWKNEDTVLKSALAYLKGK